MKRCLLLGRKAMTNLDSILKSRDITLPTKFCIVKLWFSLSCVWMWELDHKEGSVPNNWYFWTVVLEKTFDSHWHYKKIKPVHPKGYQPWIFIWRTYAEAEFCILWPPVAKSQLTGKDTDAGKDWRQGEKGMTRDDMVECIASLNQWTWVLVNSRRSWRAGAPGMLQFMGSQRVTT